MPSAGQHTGFECRRVFAAAYQGNFWVNHHGGEGGSTVIEARLRFGNRNERYPEKADVFYIPFMSRNMCVNYGGKPFRDCGLVDFVKMRNVTGMWRWLLEQPHFLQSDGSDHFLVIEPPWHHMDRRVRP